MKIDNGSFIRPHQRFSWWLTKSNYFQYMMRELSSLFIAIITLIMIAGIWQLSVSEAAYSKWLTDLWENLFWLSVICAVFATYHSISWFWVTPKAMPLSLNGKHLPGAIIIAAHIILWLLISLASWLVVTGGM